MGPRRLARMSSVSNVERRPERAAEHGKGEDGYLQWANPRCLAATLSLEGGVVGHRWWKGREGRGGRGAAALRRARRRL